MVDVDDGVWVAPHKLRTEDLHVAGQHYEVDLFALQLLNDPRFLPRFGLCGHGIMRELQPGLLHEPLCVGVVAYYSLEIACQLTDSPARQEIVQAVKLTGNQHGNSRDAV